MCYSIFPELSRRGQSTGALLATTSLDGGVQLRDSETGDIHWEAEGIHGTVSGGARCLAALPGQNEFWTGGGDGMVRRWALNSGKCIEMTEGTGSGEVVSSIAVSMDQLFVGGLRGTVATQMVKVSWPRETIGLDLSRLFLQGLTSSGARVSAVHSRKVVWLQVCGDVLYRFVPTPTEF